MKTRRGADYATARDHQGKREWMRRTTYAWSYIDEPKKGPKVHNLDIPVFLCYGHARQAGPSEKEVWLIRTPSLVFAKPEDYTIVARGNMGELWELFKTHAKLHMAGG